MSFTVVTPSDLSDNPFSLLSDEWMLVTAGNEKKYNMMTASWGGFGVMWGKNVAVTVVRPQRYTYEFLENTDLFTLSFYGNNRDIHKICGSKSGRDINKAEATGLVPVFDKGTVYFEQARLVIICKKIYASDMKPENFIDTEHLRWYDGDFHRMYVGEITEILLKTE